MPGEKLIRENKTNFPEAGAPLVLARKIRTPSQYTSKWPVDVATDADESKGVTKSMIRLRKTYVRSGLEASTIQVYRGTSDMKIFKVICIMLFGPLLGIGIAFVAAVLLLPSDPSDRGAPGDGFPDYRLRGSGVGSFYRQAWHSRLKPR